jgi:hypothetical protein
LFDKSGIAAGFGVAQLMVHMRHVEIYCIHRAQAVQRGEQGHGIRPA